MATYYWAITTSGLWGVAANWLVDGSTPAAPPGSTDAVIVGQPGTCVLAAGDTAWVTALTIAPGATMLDRGLLGGTMLTNAGSILLGGAASLHADAIANTGSIALGDGELVITGAVGAGELGAISGGSLYLDRGASLDNTGSVLTIGGPGGPGKLVFNGDTITGGTLDTVGTTVTLAAGGFGPFDSVDGVISGAVLRGMFFATHGATDAWPVLRNVTLQAPGPGQRSTLTVDGSSDLKFVGLVRVDGSDILMAPYRSRIAVDGTLQLGPDARFVLADQRGTSNGVDGSGTLANAGTISVGSGAAYLSLDSVVNTGTIVHRTLAGPYDAGDGGFHIGSGGFTNAGLVVTGGISAAAVSITDMSGTGVSNTGTIESDTYGSVTLQPGGGVIANDGLLMAAGGTLVVRADLHSSAPTVTGTVALSRNGTAELTGLYSGQTFAFSDGTGLLKLDRPGGASQVSGMASGGTIELLRTIATVETTGTIVTAQKDGRVIASFTLPDLMPGGFATTTYDAAGDTFIVACFLEGTNIRTAHGDRPVQALRVGDTVVTDGPDGPGRRRVVWLGRRRIDARRHPRPEEVWPIHVSPGAFGDGLPMRDLWLSPSHAAFVYGMLVPVRCLTNGVTIRQVVHDAPVYHHVELATHDVILAEALPCESYLDLGNRSAFERNGAAYDLYPDCAPPATDARMCAPLIMGGPGLEALRLRLLLQARKLGAVATGNPDTRLLVGQVMLRPEPAGVGLRYLLPGGSIRATLTSRLHLPRHDRARAEGVGVEALWLDRCPVGLDDPRLGAGWHAPDGTCRWTDGAARLTVAGVREVLLRLCPGGRWWTRPECDRELRSVAS